MSKQHFFYTLVLVFFLTSCGNSPATFNDTLVSEYQKAEMAYSEFTDKYDEFAKAKTLSEINEYIAPALEKINASIKTVEEVSYAGKNGAAFKNQALATLNAFKKAIEMGTPNQEANEDNAPTKRKEFKLYQDFVRYKAEVNRSTTKLIRAQQKYAGENNLRIE